MKKKNHKFKATSIVPGKYNIFNTQPFGGWGVQSRGRAHALCAEGPGLTLIVVPK